MGILTTFWTDLLGLVMAIAFLNGAVTGEFHTHRKGGGHRVIDSVKSLPARVVFLLISLGIIVWLIVDLRHKVGH